MSIIAYDRTILGLSGPDAETYLQGITTQDMRSVKNGALSFTAFLSPQGKVLFDAFIWREGTTFYIDSDAGNAEALLAFLTRYKLRAKVTFETTDIAVSFLPSGDSGGLADPRVTALPRRLYHSPGEPLLTRVDYHAERIKHAVPEAAFDSKGDDVAMDIGYDYLNGISFTKGCYVGQEVTARMHYKQITRKAVLHVSAGQTLGNSFTPITAGPLTLGTLRSFHASQGLALVRLDTWEEALISSHAILCGDIPITLTWPGWAAAKEQAWRQGKVAGSA